MNDREAIEAKLTEIGAQADPRIDLFEAGLLLAALDLPDADLDSCRRHGDALVTRAETPGAAQVDVQAHALTRALHHEAGYDGDRASYDHPDNANLVRVIDRRRGLPVALGLLYIHVGQVLGWQVRGLDVPGHFVVRVEVQSERLILDPFNGGAVVDPPRLRQLVKQAAGPSVELSPQGFAEMTKRAVLLRLQNNLKTRALRDRRLDRAAEVLGRMTMIAPDMATLWFERGALEVQLDHLTAAAAAFSTCLERTRDVKLRDQAANALKRLTRRLN